MMQAPHRPGRVFLIGAGPGAADLLTLRAARAISTVDVLLVDDLVGPAILEHAHPDARVVRVGKRSGGRSTPQDFIQRMMVRYAKMGLDVGRLKGGDPLVFGRGGEEAEYLRAHGIEPEIIPGISSGLAVPASIGVPVTHRDCAQAVTLVTARTRDNGDPDWRALAATGATLVIYMGLARLAQIAVQLAAAGMAPSTPVAVIAEGTLAGQRQVIATLDTIAGEVAAAGLPAPALIVVGEVVAHARPEFLRSIAAPPLSACVA